MTDITGILCFFDIPDIVGFVVACALSLFINPLIARSQKSKFPQLLPPKTKEEDRKWEINRLTDLYDMQGAAYVGRLERSIYIFSVMAGAYDIIAGWLIMKSFTVWMDAPDVEKTKKLHHYHNYVIGTGWSLAAGLFCGEIGKIISNFLSSLFSFS